MKKLKWLGALVGALGVSAAYTAGAETWFDGGIADGWPDVATNGAWTNTASSVAKYADGYVTLTNANEELAFTATDKKSLDSVTATIRTSVKFTAYDSEDAAALTVPADAKAGLILVDTDTTGSNPTLEFRGLQLVGGVNNGFSKLTFTPSFTATTNEVAVKIELKKVDNVPQVTYTLNDGVQDYATEPLPVNISDSTVGIASYKGVGDIKSLTGEFTSKTSYVTVGSETYDTLKGALEAHSNDESKVEMVLNGEVTYTSLGGWFKPELVMTQNDGASLVCAGAVLEGSKIELDGLTIKDCLAVKATTSASIHDCVIDGTRDSKRNFSLNLTGNCRYDIYNNTFTNAASTAHLTIDKANCDKVYVHDNVFDGIPTNSGPFIQVIGSKATFFEDNTFRDSDPNSTTNAVAFTPYNVDDGSGNCFTGTVVFVGNTLESTMDYIYGVRSTDEAVTSQFKVYFGQNNIAANVSKTDGAYKNYMVPSTLPYQYADYDMLPERNGKIPDNYYNWADGSYYVGGSSKTAAEMANLGAGDVYYQKPGDPNPTLKAHHTGEQNDELIGYTVTFHAVGCFKVGDDYYSTWAEAYNAVVDLGYGDIPTINIVGNEAGEATIPENTTIDKRLCIVMGYDDGSGNVNVGTNLTVGTGLTILKNVEFQNNVEGAKPTITLNDVTVRDFTLFLGTDITRNGKITVVDDYDNEPSISGRLSMELNDGSYVYLNSNENCLNYAKAELSSDDEITYTAIKATGTVTPQDDSVCFVSGFTYYLGDENISFVNENYIDDSLIIANLKSAVAAKPDIVQTYDQEGGYNVYKVGGEPPATDVSVTFVNTDATLTVNVDDGSGAQTATGTIKFTEGATLTFTFASSTYPVAIYKMQVGEDEAITVTNGYEYVAAANVTLTFTQQDPSGGSAAEAQKAIEDSIANDSSLSSDEKTAATAKVDTLCGAQGENANDVASWINDREISYAALAATDYATASFNLGTDLLTADTDVTITSIAKDETVADKYNLSFKIDNGAVVPAAVERATNYVKDHVRANADPSFTGTDLETTVTASVDTANSKVDVTVELPENQAKAFMKVEFPQD